MRRDDLIQRLADSENPSIRWEVRVGVLDKWHGAHWVLAALADLGYPPHDRYFKPTPKPGLGGDYVNWGSGRKAMHEWITVDALSVLHAAGRL